MLPLSLFALAMNPNLSEEQFLEQSKHAMEAKNKLIDTLIEQTEKMRKEHGTDMAMRYMSMCLPLVMF